MPYTVTTDILILGAGSSGLTAALSAAQAGKSVIILEKSAKPGGRANYAEGVFGVETQMPRAHWMAVRRDETYRREMLDTRWEANAPLLRRFENQSAETIDWLMAQGVEFEGPASIERDAQPTWHIVKGHGKALAAKLYERLQSYPNVQIMFETPATGLIVEYGKILGARARRKDGRWIAVGAGAVIVSTGGYSNNPDMLKKYAQIEQPVQYADIGCTGDGINMAHASGADFDNIGATMLVPALDQHIAKMGGRNMRLGVLGWQPRAIWVTRTGERFVAEDIAMDLVHAGKAVQRVRKSWTIFDETLKAYILEKGVDVGLGAVIPAMTKFEDFEALIAEGETECEGAVAVATGIEALSAKTGLPAATLRRTLETYNDAVDKNLDPEFAKDPRYLQKLDLTGKLYAFRMSAGILTTVGGIRVDRFLRALTTDDQPIPGLFITGNDAGGISARDSYTLGAASGTSFGFAVGSGRMAAAAAVAAIDGRPIESTLKPVMAD